MLFLIDGNVVESSTVGASLAASGFSVNAPSAIPPSPVGPTLAKAVEDCLAAKVAANRRICYTRSLRHYLGRFIKGRETQPVSAVTRSDVEAWLAKFPGASSRQTWLNRVNSLFSYCVDKEILERNPCSKIDRITIDHGTPRILTNAQCETLLRHVVKNKPTQLAYLVLGLFAGLRPGECTRTGWDSVNLNAGQVTIEARASKVRRRRVVALQPNAVAWLKLAKELNALLPPSEQSTRRFRRHWAKVLGFSNGWPSDILRHTAASQLLALTSDAGKVATMLGNSIAILHRHYFGITQPDDAAKFWAIMPEQPNQKDKVP